MAARAGDTAPAGHCVQLTAPVSAAYVPGPQLRQLVDPAVEYRPVPHGAHADGDSAPAVGRYMPAAHPVHATTPDVSE